MAESGEPASPVASEIGEPAEPVVVPISARREEVPAQISNNLQPLPTLKHVAPRESEKSEHYFSLVPHFSQIKQTATENSSGSSYTIHSDPAYGFELAANYPWNETFSTILSYSAMQLSSRELSSVSGARIMAQTNVIQAEIILLNRVSTWLRFGLGAAYGDHLFLEDFSGTPAEPQIYRASFWNSLVAVEITPFESESLEWRISLKLAPLPAQVGLGHDLTSGTEYFGEFALV